MKARTLMNTKTAAPAFAVLALLVGGNGIRLWNASVAAESVSWFQGTEQTLMNAIAVGDRAPWERVMDPRAIITTEEGEVISRAEFLKNLRPLPAGLEGGIEVKGLTVEDFGSAAVVRYLADEWETVFGQRITVKYRTTDTFRRAGSTWKLVASHVSVVTSDPPAQAVDKDDWPGFVGDYQLLPDGWTFHIVLRDGELHGGRDPNDLRQMIPLAPNTFVRMGTLGEWIFVQGRDRKPKQILNLRKFAPLVWTRLPER
jgi:Domain of unknown function (DUF4440)